MSPPTPTPTSTMRAILITRPGPPSTLQITTLPIPTPSPGEALIKIHAFGINHAEMHMRRGEWAESVPISGIECVGTIASCPSGEFPLGVPVASVMGGLGRTRAGSYAEYTVARVENVVCLVEEGEDWEGWDTIGLGWGDVAALPESYCTAWTCVFRNLGVERGERLLIRGAGSAFGRAAVNLAVDAGAVVTGTVRSLGRERVEELKGMGVVEVVLEGEGLPGRLEEEKGEVVKFDKVLDLVGNSTVVESLTMVMRDGRVCLAGWLGGLDPIKDFNPLLQMASGVHLSFFGSFVFGNPEFPLSDVPLRKIVKAVADGKFDAKPFKVFAFEEIQEAHRYMEEGLAKGKMVVVNSRT
ncbi:chaperonin 10-like protein [Podospora aff. communis PSN243]|uniref:Chaperonin 10-like protein n=1 Tax=Podospora aff. communis PSN243 TaxID=3040156 RepID=A0AAV9GFG3_9PEZI|nr:chaperonin 10-like protein [Podospora aff. communis PSN243]